MKKAEREFLNTIRKKLEERELMISDLEDIEKVGGKLINFFKDRKVIIVLKDWCSDELLMDLKELIEDESLWEVHWVVSNEDEKEYEKIIKTMKFMNEMGYGYGYRETLKDVYFLPYHNCFILNYEGFFVMLDEREVKQIYGFRIKEALKDAFHNYTRR